MKEELTLQEFVQGKTQQAAAELIGVTQGGLRKMLVSGRDIRVIKETDGGINAYEIKPVPSRKTAA